MTKVKYTLIIIFLLTSKIHATDVSGIISADTTWTLANSPYIVTGNILVSSGKSLTIDAGVEVRFDGIYEIFVDGGMYLFGIDNKRILFTSNKTIPKPGDWKRIFYGTSSSCTIVYSDFQYGGAEVDSAEALVYTRNCGYQNISFNTFSNLSCSCALDTSASILRGNKFYGSQLRTDNGVQIVTENIFSVTGIYALHSSPKIISKNVFHRGGIYFQDENAVEEIFGNIIYNCDTGIRNTSAIISSNTFYNCNTAIYIGGNVAPQSINYNNFINNNTNIYTFYNRSEQSKIDVNNNWWGTINSGEISTKIYDFYDDLVRSEVDYSTILYGPINNTRPTQPGMPYIVNNYANNYVASTGANFTWQEAVDDVGVISYNIYVSTNGGIYGLAENVTQSSYTLVGLDGYSYSIKVAALDNTGEGLISEPSTAVIIDTTPTAAVTNLIVVSVSTISINLSWTASTDTLSGLYNYQIYRSTTLGEIGNQISTATFASYTDTALINGYRYCYTIKPVDKVGNIQGTGNNQVSAFYSTSQKPYVTNAITNNYVGSTNINFVWSESVNYSGVLSYNIYVSTNSGTYGLAANVMQSSYTLVGVDGYSYSIIVSALDNTGEGPVSEPSIAVIIDTSPPIAVTNLGIISVSTTSINLSWTASTDTLSGVYNYQICRSTVSGEIGNKISTTTLINYADTSLVNGYRYYYTIKPVDKVGNIQGTGNNQAFAFYSTSAKPYVTNTIISNCVGSININFVWPESVNYSGALSYNIYVSTNSGTYGLVANVTQSSYTLVGVDGYNYSIKVSALDNTGEGSLSEPSSAIICDISPPSAVTTLNAVLINNDYVSLNWTASTDTISGVSYYSVYRSTITGVMGNKISIDTVIIAGSYEDKVPLTNGLTYYYTVNPVDKVGNIQTAGNNQTAVLFNKLTIKPNENNTVIGDGGIKIEIASGTIVTETSIEITKPAEISLPPSVKNPNLKASNVIVEIKLSDGTTQLAKEVTITIPFKDSDITGLNKSNLKLFYFDTLNNAWTLIANSVVDTVNNTVTASINHFTLFRIMEYIVPFTAIENLSNYPNPFKSGIETTKIRYVLKEDSDVKIYIYDLLGNLVLEKNISAGTPGGKADVNEVIWDGKNEAGSYVDVGAYILRIEAKGKELRRKIGVK